MPGDGRMSVSALEYRLDTCGGKTFASRNLGLVDHVYKAPGNGQATFNFVNSLRQIRLEKPPKKSQSQPSLHTAAREVPKRDPLVSEHEEGVYQGSTGTMGKYQNFGSVKHLVDKLSPNELDWTLNLRAGLHGMEGTDAKWRRHFQRPQQSFDMMKENCSLDNKEYQTSIITPQDRRPDRRMGAIAIANLREDPTSLRRWPGCEGTNVASWRHLVEDRRRGYKTRQVLKAETTMREDYSDTNGARVTDNRNDGCIVEMLGKKRWNGAVSHEPLAARPPKGDPKLHYLSQMKILPEPNEQNRQVRMSKQPRTDKDIPEVDPNKGVRSEPAV